MIVEKVLHKNGQNVSEWCCSFLDSTVTVQRLYGSYSQGGKAIEALYGILLFILKLLVSRMNRKKNEKGCKSGLK